MNIEVEQLMNGLGVVVVSAPALLVFILGISSLFDWKLEEATIDRIVQISIGSGLIASIAVLALMLITDERHVPLGPWEWVHLECDGSPFYHFTIKFVFDRLSVPFAIMSFLLGGTIGAFATRYMHRERGFNRFFVLYSLFVLGMVMASLAGTIETLFTGWELVGLSSALLVAFFQERPAPSRNGLWVWIIYRISDASFLLAAVLMHHLTSQGEFSAMIGQGNGPVIESQAWPNGVANISPEQALLIGSLILLAAAGKSALVPFSGWLPRAMEGPTPSSAVFYGALSVHLGAFLLLRVSPLLERSLILCGLVVAIGLATAIFAYLAGSVQTDIKSALSFASLSQVGIIVMEIGLGCRYIALIHILGHASLRTLQFVRAPTLLQDYRTMENAIGDRLPRPPHPFSNLTGASVRLYRFALERGYLDAMLRDYIVSPYMRIFLWCDAMERRWTDFLSGQASRETNQVKPYLGKIEELT